MTMASPACLDDVRLAREAEAAQATSMDEAWRLAGIARRLQALGASTCLADKGANLREAVRLSHNNLTLPLEGLGLTSAAFDELVRFGIRSTSLPDRPDCVHFSLFHETDLPEGLPNALAEALKFDPHTRRPYKPEAPDGALIRLTPHKAYQTPTQKSAVRALLTMPSGGTLLATMPTGAGKSLLFQLGVRWWRERAGGEKPVAVVVVPTVALAIDHAASLQEMPGLEGSRALLGDMGPDERERVLRDFQRGEVPVLFMSPESAFGSAREALLNAARPRAERVAAAEGRLAGFFIDEAHIIESWGRTFRPDFQRLRGLLADLRFSNPDLRVVLLSATVDDAARKLLRQDYGSAGPFLEVAAGLPRYEFDIVIHRAPNGDARDAMVLAALDRLPRPALVYTTTREDATRLHNALVSEKGYQRLALFTGDTREQKRREIVDGWRNGRLDLVVATSAFGMGIDKADVRAVVHACVPEDASRYYQEIGRGARDGFQAIALCLWTPEDVVDAEGLATGQLLGVEKAVGRWQALISAALELGERDVHSFPGRAVTRLPMNTAPAWSTHQPGKYNRHWNRALLNLLQRADALEVRAVAAPTDLEAELWTVLIHQPALLNTGKEAEAFLRQVLTVREEEQLQARRDVQDFVHVLTAERELCQLALLFEQVEAGRPLVPPCGRCAVCRAQRTESPKTLLFGGLKACWAKPVAGESLLPCGGVLVHPETTVDEAVERMVPELLRAGVRQFIVPDGWGPRTADLASAQDENPGLVLENHHLLSGSWQPTRVATALWIAPEAGGREQLADLVQRVSEIFKAWPEVPLVIVAPAGMTIAGRPFAQAAGTPAPYDEAGLVAMCQEGVQ